MESIHRGAIAVVDAKGTLVGGAGDPFAEVLLRSAAKPFQAAAVVHSGAAEAFSLSDEEIAIMSASHAGTAAHVAVVERLLERGGFPASALVCGPLEHMCSGKHAGMLLLARHLGVPSEGYQQEEHPVQQKVAGYIAALLAACPGEAAHGVFAGRDSCGVPVIRTTLSQAAWLYASLACGSTPALARVRDAMQAHPGLVAGEARFDTRLMQAAAGQVVAKGGAEGVEGVGLVAEERQGGALAQAESDAGQTGGLGCVVKVEDGSSRPIPLVVAHFLRAWGAADAAAAVEESFPAALVATTGETVGGLRVLVEPASLRRGTALEPVAAPSDLRPERPAPGGLLSMGRGDCRLTVSRGDEKDVLRFLRDQWPSVDEATFGRSVEWSAEPYALVYRRDKRIIAVLRGHFIGGIASVDELMVGQGHRGLGLGSLLLGRFEDESRKRKCTRVVLRAVKGSPAEDFYRGRGYHRECVQYGYEFGYDYVRLTCDVEQTLGEAGRPVQNGEGTP